MGRLPSYLLKAPAEDLTRWKAAARERGMSFAAYTRSALESATTDSVDMPTNDFQSGTAVHGDAASSSETLKRQTP